MDKVKHYLELAVKYHFWILCGVAALIGLAAWQMSTGALQSEFAASVQKIDGYIGKLNIPDDHPHADAAEVLAKRTAAVSEDVKQSWESLYQSQKQAVFIWPKELGQDFVEAIQKTENNKDEIDGSLLIRYQNLVQEQVAQLQKIVDAVDPQLALQPPVPGQPPPKYKVIWDPSSQQIIQGGFDWTERPSTQLVKFAQEEIWVYQALCNIIKKANEGATGNNDAPVKQITTMDIAYKAADMLAGPESGPGRIQSIASTAVPAEGETPAAAAAAASDSDPNSRPDPAQRGKPIEVFSLAAPADGAAPPSPDEFWKGYRYVNEKGQPLKSADVDAANPEFHLMPFRLTLKMDLRELDSFLVACRNSPLPVEVQQVRINPEGAVGGAVGGGFAGGGFNRGAAEDAEIARAYAEDSDGRGGGNRFGAGVGAVGGAATEQARDVPVEVRGVVYLIRSPDAQKLQVAPADDSSAEPPATPGGVDTAAASVPVPNG